VGARSPRHSSRRGSTQGGAFPSVEVEDADSRREKRFGLDFGDPRILAGFEVF
jgi:hypothetical protein